MELHINDDFEVVIETNYPIDIDGPFAVGFEQKRENIIVYNF